MRRRKRSLFAVEIRLGLALGLVGASCKPSPHADPVTSAIALPATKVPPSLVEPPRTVKLVPVADFATTPFLNLSTSSQSLLLANARDATHAWPVVVRDGAMHALLFDDDTVEDSVWHWAGGVLEPDGTTIVGLLDIAVEAPGWEIQSVVSVDRGRTWEWRGSFRKPTYMATLVSFEVRSIDRLRAVVELQECAGCGEMPGHYLYQSKDGGRSWAALVRKPGVVANEHAGIGSSWPPDRFAVVEHNGSPSFWYRAVDRDGQEGLRKGETVVVWDPDGVHRVRIEDLDCEPSYDTFLCVGALPTRQTPALVAPVCTPTTCSGGTCIEGICVGPPCSRAHARPPRPETINGWAQSPIPEDWPYGVFDVDHDGCEDVMVVDRGDGYFWLLEHDYAHPDWWWVSEAGDLT